jgi:DNA modification methylase
MEALAYPFDEKPPISPAAASEPEERPQWAVYCEDSRTALLSLPAESVSCIVTSPPYYWQRDYNVPGQMGQEATVEGFVENLVEVFRGVRHVLQPDGLAFLNLGDTYYSAKGRPHGRDAKQQARQLARRTLRAVDGPGLGLPRKSLLGIPWRVALALAQDGWTLRADVVWWRKSSMPEPTAHDRPWRTHEHVFMLAKSTKYHFDRTALGADEDVWEIEPDRQSAARGVHYAPFPRALVRRCLEIDCRPGGTVLDPFAGGGTTLLVARALGHASIGMDLSPQFCDIIAANMRRPPVLPPPAA